MTSPSFPPCNHAGYQINYVCVGVSVRAFYFVAKFSTKWIFIAQFLMNWLSYKKIKNKPTNIPGVFLFYARTVSSIAIATVNILSVWCLVRELFTWSLFCFVFTILLQILLEWRWLNSFLNYEALTRTAENGFLNLLMEFLIWFFGSQFCLNGSKRCWKFSREIIESSYSAVDKKFWLELLIRVRAFIILYRNSYTWNACSAPSEQKMEP